MTGALVKIGQGISEQLTGKGSWRWLPYLFLWSGLIVGAVTGAACQTHLGHIAFYLAALFAGGLIVYARLWAAQPL